VIIMAQVSTDIKTGKIPLSGVPVWTPGKDGKGDQELWSGNVYAQKAELDDNVITNYSQPQEIAFSKSIKGFQPSSGLWYQTRVKLQKENPDVEENFITGHLERVATLWRVLKVGEKCLDVLLVQYPFAVAGGKDFERDERGVPKARQVWQMAAPKENTYVTQAPADVITFFKTLYGVENLAQVPDNAYFYAGDVPAPGEERAALRSDWGWHHREGRRVNVHGVWRPSGRYSLVGFRVFEGGEGAIKDVDARKGRLIVEASSMDDAKRYADTLRELGIPFSEE
jgi:hypothetical protein